MEENANDFVNYVVVISCLYACMAIKYIIKYIKIKNIYKIKKMAIKYICCC
jgi:hypothetical protein